MRNRREFLGDVGRASAGSFFLGSGLMSASDRSAQAGRNAKRWQVTVGALRIKTVDVHLSRVDPGSAGPPQLHEPRERGGDGATPAEIPLGPERLQKMDEDGIDIGCKRQSLLVTSRRCERL
jgi:hypothetical protein